MSLWSSLFSFFQNPKPHLSLQITHLAKERFQKEILEKNSRIRSLELQIGATRSGEIRVKAGFSEKVGVMDFDIPLLVTPEVLIRLQGGILDYSTEEKAFLYFPDIDLEWKDTPNPNIKKVDSNKMLSFHSQPWVGEKTDKAPVAFWQELLNLQEVHSICIHRNWIQIEFEAEVFSVVLEERVSDLLLGYLTALPFPYLGDGKNLPSQEFFPNS